MTAPWLLRELRETDHAVVAGTFLRSYARTRAGRAAGAHIPRKRGRTPQGDAFWAAHDPVADLVLLSDVQILCDASDEDAVWAWLATSGDHVHYALIKRSVVEAGLLEDVSRALLGDRIEAKLPYTLEQACLHEMGITPKRWYPDHTFWIGRLHNIVQHMP